MVSWILIACTGPTAETASDTDDVVVDTAADTATEWSCAEPVWSEAEQVTLSRQSEVDAFCGQHSAVRGDLIIDVGGVEDTIVELDGLGCLCEVGGDLEVSAEALPEGAPPPPPHVTGDLELGVLSRIGGSLVLRNLANLTYLQELWSLASIGGDLVIEGCPDLQYSTFFGLEQLGGTLRLSGLEKLLVFRAPALVSAGGVSLGSPGDSETMFFFTELGVPQLTSLSGDVEIFGARNLGLLSAPVLESVGGRLHVEAACSLSPYMPALHTIGSLRIEGNCGLRDLSGLASVQTISGTDEDGYSLWLSSNDALTTEAIDTFVAGLGEVAGKLYSDTAGGCGTLFVDYADGYCN